ncbi:hypothetical protein T07_1131 [Trichinella nelsoni]|uniref:Uncharacterized protein n=1 Tax=Trichinella nelsoni TaxID=6336 RepID=A0A0V0RM10_9BILA|nr:hypothetical protein T07_1131 [Trichinella nelsoni]
MDKLIFLFLAEKYDVEFNASVMRLICLMSSSWCTDVCLMIGVFVVSQAFPVLHEIQFSNGISKFMFDPLSHGLPFDP